MAIQIGKYKRPGIFIEEFDNSIIASPRVFGVSSLVMGFSRKGPINTPVLLRSIGDLERIFGPLDRNLERKGSYFHRTIQKMLESNPVFAMNLLSTSDTLDKIEYESVSTATDKDNDVKREGAYRRFFDTTGFWKRDTDSFLNLISGDTGAADRLLSFTNLSDKYVSIFVFKSKVTGYNRSLIEWYGSADKVPSYLNQLDYASDYLVDVLCVGGDWSDYQSLSVDSRWSTYFNTTGLRKDQIDNFANDRNVSTLAYYQGLSLIPYFRDLDGRNIFIESVINSETDRTGLFCAYDLDKVEKDFPTGMLDLLGNNLVGQNDAIDTYKSSFNFLSYEDSIVTELPYQNVFLDIAGGSVGQNVVALGPSLSLTRAAWGVATTRTSFFAEEFINGVNYATASSSITGTSSLTFAFTLQDPNLGSETSSNAYCIVGGSKLLVNGGTSATFTYSINRSEYPVSSATTSYTAIFHIDSSTGDIKFTKSTVAATSPTIPANDLALTSVNIYMRNGFIVQTGGPTFTPSVTYLGVTGNGYNPLSGSDFTVSQVSPGKIRVTFLDTAATDVTSNYARHRRIRLFNFLVDMLDSSNIVKMAILKDLATFEKHPLTNAVLSNVITSTTQNKSFDLDLGVTTTPSDILNGNLIFYKLDNEFILGTDGVVTQNTVASGATGVAAKYSNFYEDYYTGQTNTGDFFYKNLIDLTSSTRVVFMDDGTYSYFVIDGASYSPSLSINDKLIVPSTTLNTGLFELTSQFTSYQLTDPFTGAAFPASYEQYIIDISAVSEEIVGVNKLYDGSDTGKVYLRMFLDSNEDLQTKFMNSDLDSVESIDLNKDTKPTVVSFESNYKQSIEIERPVGYTELPNKILVNATRYSEIKVGDFLEAYVDPSITLGANEVPRKLTRILSKRLYAGDNSLVEITCDSRINKTLYGASDYQTLRYTTIDDYVLTYKTISLKGFRIREASIPDGTEERQNSILNIVSKGTSLFKALTNKEALDFRYLVDSFGLGLAERSKQQLVDICGERLDCFGFINMPSIKQFKNSTSPTFVDSEGVVQTAFIATGGDPESNPAFLYSFGDGRGSTCVGYFLPYLTINDNGRQTDIPPASYVATTFLRKHNLNIGGITPWTIAAGITNGRISNVAQLEMDFSPTDIENLNQAQMNPIVFKRNRGFMIETENTAQTLYRSALSYIHVREVLIELERELSAMLLDYQWKFNTAETRAEIKLRADGICESYVNRNGLYNYFNKCDEENNTPTLIDNQIGVLDTYVEPVKGMGIIVNNITILRTGAIQAGGFINP